MQLKSNYEKKDRLTLEKFIDLNQQSSNKIPKIIASKKNSHQKHDRVSLLHKLLETFWMEFFPERINEQIYLDLQHIKGIHWKYSKLDKGKQKGKISLPWNIFSRCIKLSKELVKLKKYNDIEVQLFDPSAFLLKYPPLHNYIIIERYEKAQFFPHYRNFGKYFYGPKIKISSLSKQGDDSGEIFQRIEGSPIRVIIGTIRGKFYNEIVQNIKCSDILFISFSQLDEIHQILVQYFSFLKNSNWKIRQKIILIENFGSYITFSPLENSKFEPLWNISMANLENSSINYKKDKMRR